MVTRAGPHDAEPGFNEGKIPGDRQPGQGKRRPWFIVERDLVGLERVTCAVRNIEGLQSIKRKYGDRSLAGDLQRTRKAAGLAVEDVARLAGCSRASILLAEGDRWEYMTVRLLRKINAAVAKGMYGPVQVELAEKKLSHKRRHRGPGKEI